MTEQEMMIVIDEDTDDWESITRDEVVCQGRWNTQWRSVHRRLSDGRLFEFRWQRGSTECQDCEPCPRAQEVSQVKVTVTQYRAVYGGEEIEPTT